MNNDIWVFLKQCDSDACVEKIDVVCTHNYQVSTSLTISALCRSSFAIRPDEHYYPALIRIL